MLVVILLFMCLVVLVDVLMFVVPLLVVCCYCVGCLVTFVVVCWYCSYWLIVDLSFGVDCVVVVGDLSMGGGVAVVDHL